MDVVWHDDPRVEQVTRMIEMVKRLLHDGCICGIAQQTGASALVEKVIDLGGEELVVFHVSFSRPRQRMRHLPEASFLAPLSKQGRWERIREAEREEIGCSILLPVRKTLTGFLDLCKLVEKFQTKGG